MSAILQITADQAIQASGARHSFLSDTSNVGIFMDGRGYEAINLTVRSWQITA